MATKLKQWTNLDDKKAAYVAVVTRVLADDQFRRNCLASDEFARQAFVEVGGIDVPGDVKISFLPEGDLVNAQVNNSGSAVIEVPPAGTDPGSDAGLRFFRCSYAHWLTMRHGSERPRRRAKKAKATREKPKSSGAT